MLELLEKRAEYLRKSKFKKVERIETIMNVVKEENQKEMRLPNTFYCTFEHCKARYELLRL